MKNELGKEFYSYATKHKGISGLAMHDFYNYMTPNIIEERQMNVAIMSVFDRLLADRILFLGTGIDSHASNIINAQLLFLDSIDKKKDINLYISSGGGSVHAMNVNPDGSGVTTTSGGSEGIIIMGGYIGSAIFGNILFYCGIKCDRLSKIASYILVAIFAYAILFWLNSLFAMLWAIAFAAMFLLLGKNSKYLSMLLMFIGMLTTLFILKDFDVGPSSDLNMYESHIGLFPASVWMYIWLGIVIAICTINAYVIVKSSHFKNKM